MRLWYDFGELNILKKSPLEYLFVSMGGTILSVNLETAASLIALQGNTNEYAKKLLKKCGYDFNPFIVDEVERFVNKENLVVGEKQKPKSHRFENKRALINLREIESGPVIVQDVAVTLSDTCPLNCSYCFRKDFPYETKLTLAAIKNLNTDLRQLGCLTINISGGEPSVFPEFTAKVAKDAKEKNFENISVNTSGWKLTKNKLKLWLDSGISYINIKLDTMDAKTHDLTLKKEGAWQDAVNAIKDAVEIGLQVRINCTAYPDTLSEVEKLTKFAMEVGAYKIRINPYVPCDGLPPVHPDKVKKTVELVCKLEKQGDNVYTPINPNETLPDLMLCAAGITKAVIETDGSVGGCQFMGNYPRPAGNILKESFFDIWTKGDWSYYRDNLTTEKIAEPCYNCEKRPYCISNCIAYSLALLGKGKLNNKEEIICPWGIKSAEKKYSKNYVLQKI